MKTKKSEKRFLIGVVGLLIILLPCMGQAEIPDKINYQGYLTNAGGVPVNGTVAIVFTFYTVATGGSPIWSETQNVTVNHGVYNVNLGEVTLITSLPFGLPYYLGVKVGTDPEMEPRIPLTSVGYAFRAKTADYVYGSGTFSNTIISTVITGTAPMQVSSTTNVANLNADMLDGQHDVAFAAASHNHDGTYVNEGQANSVTSSMIVAPVNISGSGWNVGVISGSHTGPYGFGIYGEATATGDIWNYGGYFRASGDQGAGVRGDASADNGSGVYGVASGMFGKGVKGYATNSSTDGMAYGGYFVSDSPLGYGVWGACGVPFCTGVAGYSGLEYGKGVAGYGGANGYDFYATGPGINYGSTSSIRWKRNIQEIGGALGKVMSLRGVYFDWDEEHGGKHDMGFIAEEVGKVIPEIVVYEKDGVYATGVDYGAITPMLVQAIKEQQTQIEALKTEIEALKKILGR